MSDPPTGGMVSAIDALPDIDELHIGLNDLHLELGNSFLFEPLAAGRYRSHGSLRDAEVDSASAVRRGQGKAASRKTFPRRARQPGSTAAILWRAFHRGAVSVEAVAAEMDFASKVTKPRDAHAAYFNCDADGLQPYMPKCGDGSAKLFAPRSVPVQEKRSGSSPPSRVCLGGQGAAQS